MAVSLLVTVVLCLIGHILADEYVVKLDAETFPLQVEDKAHFVMFFAPWCGHCKRLHPIWDELGEKISKEGTAVDIGKVDCTVDTALCSEEDVTGYPTLKFFKSGRDSSVKYRGPRDLSSLSKFVHEQLGVEAAPADPDEVVEVPAPVHGLVELTEAAFSSHIEKGQHFIKFYAPWCGHCQKLAPVWDDLAKSLEHDKAVTIAKVDCTLHRSVCTDMEVKGYPTLLWVKDGKMREKYSGSRAIDDLKRFVARQKDDDDEEDVVVPEKPEGTVSSVVQLTSETFSSVIDDGVTFVKFFAPWCGHCKRLAPLWDELAVKFIGNAGVTIADVDCTLPDNKDLCSQYDVTGFPTLLLFRNGETIGEYEGSRELAKLHLYVNNNLVKEEL